MPCRVQVHTEDAQRGQVAIPANVGAEAAPLARIDLVLRRFKNTYQKMDAGATSEPDTMKKRWRGRASIAGLPPDGNHIGIVAVYQERSESCSSGFFS